jgi:LCP family protein required for cell wall assembly
MEKNKSNKNSWIVVGLLGAFIVICIVGAGVGWLVYKRPLGSALDNLNRSVSVATPTTAAAIPGTPVPTNTPAAVIPAALTPTSTPAGVCGETAVLNVLVLGSDANDLWYPQGADLTRVVHVDFLNKTVSIFSFSRDLWVDASSLDFTNPDIESAKLGIIYNEARMRSSKPDPNDVDLDGINAMAKTLAVNFTLYNDHYIALDLDQFPAMVDAIGGLPINIPTGFTDPLSGMVFTAGAQTLNGLQTANYARAFLDTDLNRIPRDDLVVEALYQKLLDPLVWVKIPELFQEFQDALTTDFTPEQVAHLTCLMKKVPTESIVQDGVKAEWTSPGPEGSLLWDRTKVLNRLRELGMIP